MVLPLAYLRSVRQMAPTKARSNTSKQQPVFSACFLVVGVAFHGQYLRDGQFDPRRPQWCGVMDCEKGVYHINDTRLQRSPILLY